MQTARPSILLVCLGLCWALRLLAIKLTADTGSGIIDIVFVVTTALVLIVWLANLARSKPLPRDRVHLTFYALAGLFGFGAPFVAEITVAAHLSALPFVMIVATTPILVLLFAALTRVERLSKRNTLAALVGFLAVLAVTLVTQSGGPADETSNQPQWIAAAFLVPALYALYILYIANRWPAGLDNLQGAQGQLTAAFFMIFGVWLLVGGEFLSVAAIVSRWSLWAVVALEFVGLILLFQIARMRGGSYVSQANYIAVVAGAILSTLFFNQSLSLAVMVGLALLVASLRLSLVNTNGGASK